MEVERRWSQHTPKNGFKRPRGTIWELSRVAGQLGPSASSQTRAGLPFWASSPIEMELFGRLGRPSFETWAPGDGPFPWCGPPFWSSKKHESLNVRNSQKQTPTGSTHHACCLKHVCLGEMCFLPKESCTLQKCVSFFFNGSPHFDMVSPTIRGTFFKHMGQGDRFRLFQSEEEVPTLF